MSLPTGRRFLFHKDHSLKDEPIPYVRQTDVKWNVGYQMSNGGDPSVVGAFELYRDSISIPTEVEWNGVVYGSTPAAGAGIYLRHIWHPIVKGLFEEVNDSVTVHAWTNIYSPVEQDAGALIESIPSAARATSTPPRLVNGIDADRASGSMAPRSPHRCGSSPIWTFPRIMPP